MSISPFTTSLPPELVQNVLDNLDFLSLSRLGQTCVAANETTKANHLWKKLYLERWQDSSWAYAWDWRGSFKERFVAERNWKKRAFKINTSQNPYASCSGFFFSVLSNRDYLLVKSKNRAKMIPKSLFSQQPYFRSEEGISAKLSGECHKKRRLDFEDCRNLECAALTDDGHVLGWSDKTLWCYPHGGQAANQITLSSVPKVLSVFKSCVAAGCQSGALAFASMKSNDVAEWIVKPFAITDIGFLGVEQTDPESAYFLNEVGELYYTDLEAYSVTFLFKGRGVKKCEPAADGSQLWLGAENQAVYLWDLKRESAPIWFRAEDSSIRCLHAQENFLAVGTEEGLASLYDIRKSNTPLAVEYHYSIVTHVKVEGKKIFSGSYAGELKVGFADSPLNSCEIVKPCDFAVTSLQVDPFALYATFANGSIVKTDASFDSISSKGYSS